MINKRILIWSAIMALGVGLTAGALFPKGTQALATTYYLDLHPTANNLTCGWHSGACWDYPTPVASGWALDWATSPVGAYSVFFYTKSSNGAGYSVSGTATVSYDEFGSCKHWTYGVIRDNTGTWRADAKYVHAISTTTGNVISIASGVWPQTTSYILGYTANESGCAWTNYHTHQESGGGWPNRLSYPDEDTCNAPNKPDECGIYDIDTYPMLGTSWTY